MGARLSGAARRPEDGITAAEAVAQVLSMIEGTTRPILGAYPQAERLSWDAKEAEAVSFMAAAAPVVSGYPLLRGEVAAELEIAPGEVTLIQLADKVEAVLWMASQWRALVSFLSGLRKRTEVDIYAAADDAGRRAVVEAARAAIAAVSP